MKRVLYRTELSRDINLHNLNSKFHMEYRYVFGVYPRWSKRLSPPTFSRDVPTFLRLAPAADWT